MHTWRIRFPACVRVYEVNDSTDWRRLCVRYPARGVDDDRLVPNWGAGAGEWDGVHLTFGGLLGCEQVCYADAAGWSMNQLWQIELTCWLTSLATVSERWRDYAEMRVRPVAVASVIRRFKYRPTGSAAPAPATLRCAVRGQ